MSPPASPPFWSRDRHAERRDRLLARTRVASFARRWFDADDFVEVDTAALQVSPGNETHLHGFRTTLVEPNGSKNEAWLHTSPEFAMKKLLAAGETKVFSMAHVFRNRERSALHAPEFTMLEWYRVGAPLSVVMNDCARLLALAAHVTGARTLRFRGREADPFEPPERITVREAFRRHTDIDLYESLYGENPDSRLFARQAVHAGVRVAPDDTWSDIFSRLLSERVEPSLGAGRATILHQVSRERSGACAGEPRRSAHSRTFRAVLLRRRARQCFP